MSGRRALIVWLAIIIAESIHGVLRQLFLAPIVGDMAARQIGVVVGSLLVFAVALTCSRWLGARGFGVQLAVGAVWVVLTLGFELAFGALLGLGRERMLADYDVSQGGYMVFGLLVMLLSPALAARLRR